MNRLVFAMAASLVLAACGSTVKMDTVPVEDKSGTGNTQSVSDGKAGVTGVGQSGVISVDLGKSNQDSGMQASTRLVYFDYDSSVIRPEFQPVLEAHARFIKADPRKKIAIEGHTDERGGREYNIALGQKRAEAVKRALGLLGVSENQIEAVSFGKEKPADLGMSEASMEKNRRAEIVYR
jgi:peptidoglycan-associated lipoprotein